METVPAGNFEFKLSEQVVKGRVHPLWKQLEFRPDDRWSMVMSVFCPEAGEPTYFLTNRIIFNIVWHDKCGY
eukprot:3082249-Amphidinium_carterae.1